MFNKKQLKKQISERGFQIGNSTLEKAIKIFEQTIKEKINLATRNALLEGRKKLKERDFEED